jgi:hypothetical protein
MNSETRTFGGNAHRDRAMRTALSSWPRLMSLAIAADYLSLSKRTLEDWVHEGLLQPVPMPGAAIRKNGNIVAHAKARRIAKILIDRADLDLLIDQRKANA